MTKFGVVITYDPEYRGYVVDVPELPGCMSQGKTFDEARENIKDAIRGWLRVEKKRRNFFTCKANGEASPQNQALDNCPWKI